MSDGLKLIASVLEHNSMPTFRQLQRDWLVDEVEWSVYDFVSNHFRRYSEFPTIETVEEETGVSLPEVPEHIESYLDAVYSRKIFNDVRDGFPQLRSAMTSEDARQIAAAVRRIHIACVPLDRDRDSLSSMAELAEQVSASYRHHHASPGHSGIFSGWPYIDNQTGGAQPGDLIVWVARSGVGKTWSIIHQAKQAIEDEKSVLFVSMEMTLVQIMSRFAAYYAGLNPDMVRKGTLCRFGENRLHRALDTLRSHRRVHFYAGNFKKTTEDVDTLVQELNPDIVFVDGLYLMRPAQVPGRVGRYESTAYVVDELKRMALMRNVPVVATTQFGRGAGKGGKDGSLETIGYTDAISTHSTVVVALKMGQKVVVDVPELHWEEGDVEPTIVTKRATRYPYRHVEIMKGREGETGEFGINFTFAPIDFSQVPLDIATGARMDAANTVDLSHMI